MGIIESRDKDKKPHIYVETQVLGKKPGYFVLIIIFIIKKVQQGGNIYRRHEPNKKNKKIG